jgi:predicted ATP-binding protein involved in virulence
MRIDKITLQNFRCFEQLEVEFLPNFNVIIGNNGTGKSSLLKALRIALEIFMGEVNSKPTYPLGNNNNTRLKYFEKTNTIEEQLPTILEAQVTLQNTKDIIFRATREPNTSADNSHITHLGVVNSNAGDNKFNIYEMVQQVRSGTEIMLPVVAYFSPFRKFETTDKEVDIIGAKSRLVGYEDAIDEKFDFGTFANWFKNQELIFLQEGKKDFRLELISKAVSFCIPNCESISYSVKLNTILAKFKDEKFTPIDLLSDGFKSMLAMVADIAYRCINLNPHLGENALESAGVVLIDELDVHLHPNWQKKVVKMLKTAFPNIQFIVTTHSPLILHSLELGDRIINLEDNQVDYVDNMFGRDANDTLLQIMDTKIETPFLKEYVGLVESGKGKTEEALKIRQKIENLVGRDYKELAKVDALMQFYNKNV